MTKNCSLCLMILAAIIAANAEPKSRNEPAPKPMTAEHILQSTDRTDGLCVLVNASDPELPLDLARKSKFLIHMLHRDRDVVNSLRDAIDKQGTHGRILVSRFNGSSLPYAENLVNLVVAMHEPTRIPNQELLRILAPYGFLYQNGQATRKPYPSNLDEWTHFRYSAEGNMVSQDTEVAPPRHVRWVADPPYQRSHALTPTPTTMVTAGGRLFTIEDDTPMGFAGLPDQWRLIARDAFNGKRLWSRDIPIWGNSAWSWHNGSHEARFNHPKHVAKRLVAVKDRVFVTLGFNAAVSAIDAKTGTTVLTYEGTEFADEMVYLDGILYVCVNDRKQGPLPAKGFEGTPLKDNPSRKMIWAIQAKSGDVLWKAGPYGGITGWKDRLRSMTSTMLVASMDGVFVAADSKTIVKIDRTSGKELLRVPGAVSRTLDAFFYHKGTLVIGSRSKVTAIDGNSGKEKWTNTRFAPGNSMPTNFGIGNLIWVADEKEEHAVAWDIETGSVKKKISMAEIYDKSGHHPRCYPLKSTTKYMLSSRRALETLNYETGDVTLNHWARATCRLGHIPANGLLYKGPDPCLCHLAAKLSYMYALAGENTTAYGKQPVEEIRLEKGAAYRKVAAKRSNPASEWPQFRHDAQRSSSVETTVPQDLKTIWGVEVSGKITAPVVAGGSVYISAVDQCKVYAFDEQTGKERWSYPVGANVDSPPTYYNGMVIFGSADGYVYSLRASDGALAWRFRAAPYERYIMAFNRVESAWPVHGSVLIANGLVYCTAGRSSFLDKGIHLFVLDALTGKVMSKKNIHHVQKDNGTGLRADQRQMPDHAPGAPSNILVTDGSKIFSRRSELDFGASIKRGPQDYGFPATEALLVPNDFSDQLWFHKTYWSYGRNVKGVMICFDPESAYYCNQFEIPKSPFQRKLFVPTGGDTSMIADRQRYHEVNIGIKHLADIDGGGVLLARDGGWKRAEFPIAPFSMVLTNEKLLVAGFELEIDPADPWGKIEGRKGSVLWILSKKSGAKLSELSLETLPVWNGMTAANKKVFISLKSGKLICLGNK